MNWGNKIIFVFIAFILLIGTLVYKSYQVQTELVSPDYYKDEIAYQQVINASNNTSNLSKKIEVEQNGKTFKVNFPEEINPKTVSGDIQFYCAYDSKNDLKFSLQMDSSGYIQYEKEKLNKGTYTLKIDFRENDKNYRIEKNIIIND